MMGMPPDSFFISCALLTVLLSMVSGSPPVGNEGNATGHMSLDTQGAQTSNNVLLSVGLCESQTPFTPRNQRLAVLSEGNTCEKHPRDNQQFLEPLMSGSELMVYLPPSPKLPLLSQMVQELSELCYQLNLRLSHARGDSSAMSKPPPVLVPEGRYEVLERITLLQQCVSLLNNYSLPGSASISWQQRFQPLEAFAEHYKISTNTNSVVYSDSNPVPQTMLQKESGERVNFADAGNGAKILAANPAAKKPHRAIDGNPDSFLFNECKAIGGMWILLELSHVARVKVLELTMRELYSSRIADFVVFGRLLSIGKGVPNYPQAFYSSNWNNLGKYTAENTKGSQKFSVPQSAWVKYLGIHFLSHHGSETACTLNEIGVYGVAPEQDLEAFDPGGVVAVPSGISEQFINQLDNSSALGDDDTSQNITRNSTSSATARPREGEIQHTNNDKTSEPQPVKCSGDSNATDEEGGHGDDSHISSQSLLPDVEPSEEIADNPQVVGERFQIIEEPPALAAHKRLRLELQELKNNGSMLATYVDGLRSGLLETIDELWMAIARIDNRSTEIANDLGEVVDSVRQIQHRLQTMEESSVHSSWIHRKLMIGMVGIGAGFAAVMSTTKYHHKLKQSAVLLLSVANILVGLLNWAILVGDWFGSFTINTTL